MFTQKYMCDIIYSIKHLEIKEVKMIIKNATILDENFKLKKLDIKFDEIISELNDNWVRKNVSILC